MGMGWTALKKRKLFLFLLSFETVSKNCPKIVAFLLTKGEIKWKKFFASFLRRPMMREILMIILTMTMTMILINH